MNQIATRPVLLSVFAVSLATGVVPPLMPAIQREFTVSATGASLLLSVFGITRLLVDLPAGRLVRALSPRLLLTVGTVCAALAGAAAALAPNYPILLASRAVLGIGSAISLVVSLAVLAQTAKRADVAMSHFYIAMFVAQIVSPALGGLVADRFGWRSAFALIAAFSAISGAEICRRLRRADFRRVQLPTDATPTQTSLIRTAPVWTLYLLSFVALALFTGAKMTILPLYGADQFGLSTGDLGLIFMATTVFTPATMLGVARVTSRSRQVRLIATGLAVWIVGLAVLLVPRLPAFLAAAALFDIAGGLMYSTPYAVLTTCVPRGAVGQAMGEVRLPADLAWLIVPPLIGVGLDLGGAKLPIVALTIVTLVALVAVRLFLSEQAITRGISLQLKPDQRP